MGGSSSSNKSGDKTENNRCGCDDFQSYDYWIIKLDSKGKIQWDKTIGGNDYDWLTSLQQTKDGGYILGGYSYSNKSGEKTENRRGPSFAPDYWIVKLDASGNIQWDKTIGGNSYDWVSSLQQTSDGGYILGGSSTSNKSGDKTENNRCRCDADQSPEDYWIVKLNNSGSIQWDKTIGGSSGDGLNSLQQTSDGGYILGGYSYSGKSGEKTENSRGLSDYWVVKISSTGKIQWDKTIGGNDQDQLSALQQTSDGGYILGGGSVSNKSGEKTQNRKGRSDYWVVKTDGQGKIQWDKTIGGSSVDGLTSVQQTKDGGYILGGNSASNKSGDKTENNRCQCLHPLPLAYDYWMVKLNNQGKIQWDKTIGGDGSDNLTSIKEIDKDRYVTAGSSLSGISGDKTKPSKGGYDYWLVWLNDKSSNLNIEATSQNVSSLITTNNDKMFTFYPNPARYILHIQTNDKTIFSLTNQSGKILLTKAIEGNGVINVAGIPAGLYYLKNNTTGAVQKLILSK